MNLIPKVTCSRKGSWIIAFPLAIFLSIFFCSLYFLQRNILYLLNNLQDVASYLATQSLGQKVSIGKVNLALFKGEISLRDIEVLGTNPAISPLANINKLSIRFNPFSIFKGQNFLQSIKKVEVDKVSFNLFCDEKGHWNLPKPKPTKPPRGILVSFPVEIGTIEGVVHDSFFSKQVWKLKGRGRIIFNKATTAFLIQGKVNDSPFVARGIKEKERANLGLSLKSLSFSFPQAKGIISTNLLLQLKGGRLQWGAQAKLENASINYERLPLKIQNCSLNFIGDQNVCKVSQVKFSSDKKVSFKNGEGIFALHKPHTIYLKGILEGSSSSFLPLVETAGGKKPLLKGVNFPLRAELEVVGDLTKPILSAKLTVPKIYVRGLAINDSSISVRYFGNRVELREGKSDLLGGKIRYQGLVDLRTKSYILGGEGINLDLVKIPTNLKLEAERALKIQEFPQGKLEKATFWSSAKSGEAPSFELEAQISQLKYVKVYSENLYTKLNYKDGTVKVEKIEARDEKGAFAFVGEVDTKEQKLEGDVEGMDIDIGKIARLFGIDGGRGLAYIRGKINGTFEEPKFEGGIEAFDIGFRDYDVDYLLCQIEGDEKVLRISELDLTKGIGKGKAYGVVNLSTGIIRFDGEVNDLLLSQLLHTDLVKSGVGEGRFTINGNIRSPSLEINCKAENILLRDNLLRIVNADLSWENGKALVQNGKAFLGEGEIDFNGKFEENKLLLNLQGKRISLSQFPFAREGIEGYVDVTGKVEGPVASPYFQGEVVGDIVYNGEAGKLSANLLLDKSFVEGTRVFYTIGKGALSASFSYNFEQRNISGYISGKDLPLELIDSLSHRPIGLKGKMSIELTMAGRPDESMAKGLFRCEELGNHYIELSRLDGDFFLEGKNLRVENVRGEKGNFKLDGQAEVDLAGKSYALAFEAKNLPLSMLQSLLPQIQPEGEGNATIIGKGSFASPSLSLSFNSPLAQLNGVELENIKLSADWVGEDLNLKHLEFRRGGNEVKGEAILPFGIKGGFNREKPLYLAVSWDKQDISWLSKLAPFFEELKGEVSGNIVVKGSYDEPNLSGSLIFQNGYVKPKGFVEGLKNTNVRLAFQNNRATFEDASFSMGEGRGEIKGNIYMGREGLKMETVVSLRNATLKENNISGYGEKLRGELNGFLNLAGNIRTPLILGSLSISNANFDFSSYVPPKGSKETTVRKAFNPSFLITVGLGNNCWFISSGSRVLAEGRLNLIGTLNNPRLQGHFASRSGLLLISGYIFRLREASADLAYVGNVLNLNVYARADTQLRGYKITAYINGPYDNLKLRFTSSPPLPQNTILAMFVPEEFLGNPEQFFKNELANAFAYGLGAKVLGPLEFALAEATGLEEISFEYGLEGYPILTLKQSILPKTYLVYSRWLATPTPRERWTFSIERNIGGDIYLTFTTDELKRKIWGIEGTLRF